MNIRKLFFKRLRDEAGFQFGVIRTVIDVTSSIYIVIFLGFFVGSLYVDGIEELMLFWQEHIPFFLLLALLFLLTIGGNYRTYLLHGDLIFLIQRKKELFQLKAWGIGSSIFATFLQIAILLAVGSPLLILAYDFSVREIFSLFLIISANKFIAMTIRKSFKKAWLQGVCLVALLIVMIVFTVSVSPVIFGLVGGGLMIVTLFFQLKMAKENRQFYRELEIEGIEHHKYVAMILAMAKYTSKGLIQYEKAAAYHRKKPLVLFRKSGRIFKHNRRDKGLLEFCLKAFLRNKNHRAGYYYAVMITSGVIIFLPPILKVILVGVFCLFMYSWTKGVFQKITKHQFFHVVAFDEKIKGQTERQFQLWVVAPAMILIGLSLLFS